MHPQYRSDLARRAPIDYCVAIINHLIIVHYTTFKE
nr:MAG TPA: hypothetical protein [Caudoviricetes sp.]